MRGKGISYDTGWVRGGVNSRESFDPAVVARELRIIRDDLHCTAVRIMWITYAAVPLERVDWAPFDIVSVDLYRSREIADRFTDGVRTLVAQGKPVAITEFGAATYRGAADLGPRALEVLEYDEAGAPVRLNGEYVRDEAGQAGYVRELLEVFDAEGVDSAFVFAFALNGLVHRPDGDPRDDLDLASYGIVAVLDDRTGATYPDLPWEPKAAFTAVAESYR